jgi:hypothetical protein
LAKTTSPNLENCASYSEYYFLASVAQNNDFVSFT